jgi:hypothetical protein
MEFESSHGKIQFVRGQTLPVPTRSSQAETQPILQATESPERANIVAHLTHKRAPP